MKSQIREHRKPSVKFCVITIAERRTKEGAKVRNPPPFVAQTPDKSQAVRSQVEAVIQQWAEHAQ